MKFFLTRILNKLGIGDEKRFKLGSRSGKDRRSGEDRRREIDEGFLSHEYSEKRQGAERRIPNERRNGWIRIGKWKSALR
ncbi:hypothetical protein DENIS_2072 [Desulfonema ishimotonii]|uniref:Uncharacterized protein n=1 Tax=Desulfonema ishimotonii TaxID=45657 RepID=A0A401FVV5_9BACT|nr:hypothetical protein [Desulfonema ishimotonii]GBC61112.1 hypothetical protein DENIS_2072 [Desulfonema ishimotonii]